VDELFNIYGEPWDPKPTEPNPCRRIFGPGPESKRCKHCAHLQVRQFANRYHKCPYRGMTHGAGTDMRVNWAACAKFKEV
jgi:hypothetical protein